MDKVGFLAELKGKDQVMGDLQDIANAVNKLNGTHIDIRPSKSGVSELHSQMKMVSKEIDPATSKATTRIERLDSERRILEVARMLSGSSLTDAAIANAKSLLSI